MLNILLDQNMYIYILDTGLEQLASINILPDAGPEHLAGVKHHAEPAHLVRI